MRATSVIWRTVVFAGAMLATPACKKSSTTPSTTPAGETSNEGGDGQDPCGEEGTWGDPCDGYGDPCDGRARGGGEGGEGRGFVLS